MRLDASCAQIFAGASSPLCIERSRVTTIEPLRLRFGWVMLFKSASGEYDSVLFRSFARRLPDDLRQLGWIAETVV
jgi:hypothetical protein